MEILFSSAALKAFERLSTSWRKTVFRKIDLLLNNPTHPSLKVHRLNSPLVRMECYISDFMRLIYEIQDGVLTIYDLGGHKIIDDFHKRRNSLGRGLKRISFEPTSSEFSIVTAQAELENALLREKSTAEIKALKNGEWSTEKVHAVKAGLAMQDALASMAGSDNHFAFFQDAHLRILGVPASLVDALKSAPSLEEALSLSGLSDKTREWLFEISTSPEFADVVNDSMRLLYRTTLNRLNGYCEGKIRLLMLNLLQPEQQQFVDQDRFPVMIVKGSAGSGKTTIGIYRAIRCAGQGARVLIVTFNRTLSRATRSLITDLIGPLPENLQVTTIHQLMHFLLETRGRLPGEVKDDRSLLPYIKAAVDEVRQVVNSPVLQRELSFFQAEFRYVISGLGLKSLAEYKEVERYGRKTALHVKHRKIVWLVYQAYQRKIARLGYLPLHELGPYTLRVLDERPPLYYYDEVIIDEAQDLTLTDLLLVQRLVTPARARDGRPGRILILTDAAQTIYSRGFSWKKLGIEARGHTAILSKNYRNTRPIAEAAAQLLAQNVLLRQEYTPLEWTHKPGTPPVLLTADSRYGQIELTAERIFQLVEEQIYRPSDIALICPTLELCQESFNELVGRGLRATLYSSENFQLLEEEIKVLTIHSAKGLEFPVVFLLGLVEGLLPAALGLQRLEDEEEQTLFLEQQRSLMYVGMTRSAESLFLVTTRGQESRFLKELQGKILL